MLFSIFFWQSQFFPWPDLAPVGLHRLDGFGGAAVSVRGESGRHLEYGELPQRRVLAGAGAWGWEGVLGRVVPIIWSVSSLCFVC